MAFSIAKIQGPRSLRRVPIREVTAFEVSYAQHHAYLHSSLAALENISHPRHLLVKRSYNERTEPLWWNCLVSNKTASKKVVRSWLNNRTKIAVIGALQRRGYARDGSKLPVEASTTSSRGDLVGSAQFRATTKLLHTSWFDLNEQADKAIIMLEKVLRKIPGKPETKIFQFKRHAKMQTRSAKRTSNT